MLVFESADPRNGDSWYNAFATLHTTQGARRLAAMTLAWPDGSVEMPNSDRPSYNAMAMYWKDKGTQLRQLAAGLAGLKGWADTNVGQNVAVFTQGSPESLDAKSGTLLTPVELHVGRVAGSGTVGNLHYLFAGRRVRSEEDKSRPQVAMKLSVGVAVKPRVQKLSMNEVGVSAVSDVPPSSPSSMEVLHGGVTFNEGWQAYEHFREFGEFPVVFGNTAVNGLLRRLTLYEGGEAHDRWAAKPPTPDEPLPNLGNFFPRAVIPDAA
jgi:hypothetical protein